jgi:hypothetical protein
MMGSKNGCTVGAAIYKSAARAPRVHAGKVIDLALPVHISPIIKLHILERIVTL